MPRPWLPADAVTIGALRIARERGRHRDQRAADLERARRLERLQLQPDVGAEPGAGTTGVGARWRRDDRGRGATSLASGTRTARTADSLPGRGSSRPIAAVRGAGCGSLVTRWHDEREPMVVKLDPNVQHNPVVVEHQAAARGRRPAARRRRDHRVRRLDALRLHPRGRLRDLDGVHREEPVAEAHAHRVARGDLPLDVRDDRSEPGRRRSSRRRPTTTSSSRSRS